MTSNHHQQQTEKGSLLQSNNIRHSLLSDTSSDEDDIDEDFGRKQPWQNDSAKLISVKNKKLSKVFKKPYHMPEDFINLSFLACCMFFPVGILAIHSSYKVQYFFDIGDIEKSKLASKRTHRLAKRAIIIGSIILACIIAFLMTLAFTLTILFKPNDYY